VKQTEFSQSSYDSFRTQALDAYSFKTCTYPGGESYGISDNKKCRKAPEGAKEEKEPGSKNNKGAGGGAADVPPAGSWDSSEAMNKAADAWRKTHGLENETESHDTIHMMVHSFAQKGSAEIGALTNEKGVSSTEEVLVNLAAQTSQGYSKGDKLNRAELVKEGKSFKQYLEDELSPAQAKNFDKAVEAAVTEFMDMSTKPDFDRFMMYVDAYGFGE